MIAQILRPIPFALQKSEGITDASDDMPRKDTQPFAVRKAPQRQGIADKEDLDNRPMSDTRIPSIERATRQEWRLHFGGILFLALAVASLALLPLLPGKMAQQNKNDLPFLENVQEPYVLAYMGYPGCSEVCPISLGLLADAYRQLTVQGGGKLLRMTFVNIAQGMPDVVSLNYARQFHPKFTAYSVTAREAKTFYQSLSLKTYNKTEDPSPHTDFIYLFKQNNGQWNLERVYFKPPSAAALVSRILEDTSPAATHKET